MTRQVPNQTHTSRSVAVLALQVSAPLIAVAGIFQLRATPDTSLLLVLALVGVTALTMSAPFMRQGRVWRVLALAIDLVLIALWRVLALIGPATGAPNPRANGPQELSIRILQSPPKTTGGIDWYVVTRIGAVVAIVAWLLLVFILLRSEPTSE